MSVIPTSRTHDIFGQESFDSGTGTAPLRYGAMTPSVEITFAVGLSVWICRSRICFISAAPSGETTTCILLIKTVGHDCESEMRGCRAEFHLSELDSPGV